MTLHAISQTEWVQNWVTPFPFPGKDLSAVLKDQSIHWAPLKTSGAKHGAVTCLSSLWWQIGQGAQSEGKKQRAALQGAPLALPVCPRPGWCPACAALCPERLAEVQGAARPCSGDVQGRGTSQASAYFMRNPQTGGAFKDLDVHEPEFMKALQLVSNLGCWGTQKLDFHWGVSSSPKIINVFLDS